MQPTKKQLLWKQRIGMEIAAAEKSLLLRLSFRPRGRLDFHTPAADKREYPEVQRWLKRVRKKYGSGVRVCVIGEFGGEGGRLHYHALLHGPRNMRSRVARREWKQGYTHAIKVARGRVGSYLAKYLSKDDALRPRASVAYGSHGSSVVMKAAKKRLGHLGGVKRVYEKAGPYRRLIGSADHSLRADLRRDRWGKSCLRDELQRLCQQDPELERAWRERSAVIRLTPNPVHSTEARRQRAIQGMASRGLAGE